MKKINLRTILLAIMVIAMGCLTAWFILKPAPSLAPSTKTAPKSLNGDYEITKTQQLTCTKSIPARCTGAVVLSSANTKELVAKIDESTTIRHESQEIQLYPDTLYQADTNPLKGHVTFKAGTSVVSTIVLKNK